MMSQVKSKSRPPSLPGPGTDSVFQNPSDVYVTWSGYRRPFFTRRQMIAKNPIIYNSIRISPSPKIDYHCFPILLRCSSERSKLAMVRPQSRSGHC